MTAPVLTGFAPTITFAENTVNATPQLLDPAVVFSDAEGDFNGGTLTLSGLLSEDRVSVLNQGIGAGQIGLSGGNVTYAGLVIGTLTGGSGTTLGISFNAAATSVAIDRLIQNLTYANLSDTPTAERTLVVNVTDAAGQDIVRTAFTPLAATDNPFIEINAPSGRSAPSFVDLDGDGDGDLVLGGRDGRLQFWTVAGGVFTKQTGAANPFNDIAVVEESKPSFVDLDGDGDLDLVVGGADGKFEVWTNATGVFTAQAGAANPLNSIDVGDNSTPSFVDVDGDGDFDLISGEKYGTLKLWTNAAGVFTEQTGAANPFSGIAGHAPSFFDLDGHGDLDLILGSFSGKLGFWTNAGGVYIERTGAANPFGDVYVTLSSTPSFVDLNGDGDLDLVVGNYYGDLTSFENTIQHGAPIVVTVTAETDTFTGTSGNDTLFGTAGPDAISGLAGNDTLYGGTGNDILQGNAGNDLLVGGVGNDSYFVDAQDDIIVEIAGNGTRDRVVTTVNYVLGAGANIELLTTTNALGTEALNLTGNALAQTIIGNAGANRLEDGLGAADTLYGGDGSDTYVVHNAGTLIVDSATGFSINVVMTNTSYSLANAYGIHVLSTTSFSGTTAINLIGNGVATLIGNAGVNRLEGGVGGGGTLIGGAGNDTYVVNSSLTQITETAGGGTVDTLLANVDFSLAADDNIEIMAARLVTGTTDISLTGNALSQRITGNAGRNTLEDGLGAADTLIGGAGNDYYIIDTGSTVVIEAAGEGLNDLLYANTSYVLGAGVSIEQLCTLDRFVTAAINLTGNALSQAIEGNNGVNILDGGLGAADNMAGWGGNDTYIIRNTDDQVTEFSGEGAADRVLAAVSFVLSSQSDIEFISTLTPSATTAINLTGNVLAQTITGNAGINRLEDGLGAADILNGGARNDTYVVHSAGTRVIEAAGGGTMDRVLASTSFILNTGSAVEFLSTADVAGTTSINLTGNALAQRITGNAGINRLEDGLGAADTLIGGAGNDTYVVRNAGTQVFEGAAGGTADRVLVNTSYALTAGAAVEFLSTTDAAGTSSISLAGNALAQRITGNAGSNELADGKGAADTLVGGAGSDVYLVSTATTVIIEGAGQGYDRVATSVSFVLAADDDIEMMSANFLGVGPSINLTGNALSQIIEGNMGDNRLDGKAGSDTLWGYGGADVFVFSSTLGTNNVDKIANYNPTINRIDIDNAVFAGLAAGALAATAFTGNIDGIATTAAQRIIYESDTGFLWFDADGSGAGARVQFARLAEGLAMTAGEFLVI